MNSVKAFPHREIRARAINLLMRRGMNDAEEDMNLRAKVRE